MAKSFKELRESVVKTADKKPEKFTKPDGKVGIRMVPVNKQIIKNEDKDLDELSMTAIKKGVTGSGMKNVAKAMGKDKLKKDLEDMKARMATESTQVNEGPFKGVGKAMMKAKIAIGKNTAKNQANTDSRKADTAADKGDMTGYAKNKSSAIKAVDRYKRLSKAQDRLNRESTQVDEVLDRPGALDSYKKKAKMQSDKARNSATAKIVRGNPDISKEKETIRKREKGQDMADRTGARQFRKSIGRPYAVKKEEVEYVNEKLKVSDGMGAWVDDFKKSDAPQFKGKSDKERREMAIAAYLSAKRGDKR